jgi:long-chain acyl-CoA synthetase
MDDEGAILPPGETGEICIRGPQITPGYWRDPEATAATIVDGWLHSGDMGHLDEDGYVYITDRRKDLIIRGGLNVYPRDVEEVLYAHPAVAEAAVVGRPDPALGEAVIACVVLRPGAEAQPGELLAWCGERLARYKLPAEVRLLDALPKTPIGKILKRDLRALVAEPV